MEAHDSCVEENGLEESDKDEDKGTFQEFVFQNFLLLRCKCCVLCQNLNPWAPC